MSAESERARKKAWKLANRDKVKAAKKRSPGRRLRRKRYWQRLWSDNPGLRQSRKNRQKNRGRIHLYDSYIRELLKAKSIPITDANINELRGKIQILRSKKFFEYNATGHAIVGASKEIS